MAKTKKTKMKAKKTAKPAKKFVKKTVKAKKTVSKAKSPAFAKPKKAVPLQKTGRKIWIDPAPTGDVLKKGDMAPNFRIPNDAGHESGLSDFIGRQVVLYFYPKDDTPGCTYEASRFRDGLEEISKHGASVVGINCDTPESHKAFREKHGLNFHLLSDTTRDVVKKYGVWKDDGIERTTFVIDANGRIKTVFPNVDVKTHYDDVIKALR